MCRTASVVLPPRASSPSLARSFTADTLHDVGLQHVASLAVLLVSELTTNAALHAGTHFTLRVAVAADAVEIGVRDEHPGGPSLPSAHAAWAPGPLDGAEAEGGRGLAIVDAAAQEWGVTPLPFGKEVWFRLGADEGWIPAVPCECAQTPLEDSVRLSSGRWARDSLASPLSRP